MPDNAAASRVSSHVMDELGRPAGPYALAAYDAAWVAGLALAEAGPGGAAGAVPGAAAGHGGALGDVELNAAGDLASASYDAWAVVDGAWAVTGTY